MVIINYSVPNKNKANNTINKQDGRRKDKNEISLNKLDSH